MLLQVYGVCGDNDGNTVLKGEGDSWQEISETLDVDEIVKVLRSNIDAIKEIIKLAVAALPEKRDCQCASALSVAIATSSKNISAEAKKKYELLIGKYLKGDRPSL